MIKNLKKLFTVIFTSVLFLCLAIPVNAASETHKITIKNAGSGHTYEVYEVFKGNVSTSGHIGDADWGSGVDSTKLLQALKDSDVLGTKFDDCTTANDVIAILSTEEDDSDTLKELAQIIGENLASVKTNMTYSGGKYEATLEPGYYFIKDKDGSQLAQTRYILTLTEDQEIVVKGETPTIAVGSGTGSSSSSAGYVQDFQVGDEITLQMAGSLPNYNSFNDYQTYKYAFHVTIPEGLKVVGDTATVELYKGSEKIEDLDLTCLSYAKTSTGFDVACDNLKSIVGLAEKLKEATGTVYSSSTSDTLQIKVTYKVTATPAVKFINSITQNIEYSNNPNRNSGDSTTTTPNVYSSLYTYTLELNKKEKGTAATLDNVGFKLYRTDDNKWAKVENGVILEWVSSGSDATELFTENGGKISLIGLDSQVEYAIKETNPLDGYNTIEDAKLLINAEFGEPGLTKLEISVNSGDPTAGNTDTGLVSILVENSQGKMLPTTGGIGTILFYIIGILLIILALILIIIILKKKDDDEEDEEEAKSKGNQKNK